MARDGFHDELFPLEVSLGAQGGPKRRTDIVRLASGREVRRGRWSRSYRSWDVACGVQTFDEAERVLAFFEAREGRRFAFAFRDPIDQASAPIGTPITGLDQFLGTGDGSASTFPLKKSYGSTERMIELAVTGSVIVAIDGIEAAPTEWSLSFDRNTVEFGTPPAPGASITAGFFFDVPVRFAEDSLVLERGSRGASIPRLSLEEVSL